MLLTGRHLQALETSEMQGAMSLGDKSMNQEVQDAYHVLEVQGLADLRPEGRYLLTESGREAVHLLVLMHEQALLPPTQEMAGNWRFLGSEVLTALAAADRVGGEVGPVTEELLRSRGLADETEDEDHEAPYVRLNSAGIQWLQLLRTCRPRVEITPDLATTIRHLPPSYSPLHAFDIAPGHLELLEAMDLLVWSVPDAEVYALSALGEAVSEAIEKGGYPSEGIVLDDMVTRLLVAVDDEGSGAITSEQCEQLQRLGYVDADSTLTSAGEAALRVRRIVERGPDARPASFAITSEEMALLRTVQSLSTDDGDTAQPVTKLALHTALLDRAEKQYQEFVREYGRTTEDVKARKREAQEIQSYRREQARAVGRPAEIDELIMQLEAWDLLRGEVEGAQTVCQLTARGRAVLLDQQHSTAPVSVEDVTAAAVKAITAATSATRFGAPATAWIQQAHAEGLIGSQGITRRGRFFAGLAVSAPRIPVLTRHEAEMLINLPTREPAMGLSGDGQADVEIGHALDRLEARGLIDRLVDGQIVRTETGITLTHAVQGALELAYPVTPSILRLLLAVQRVGETLYAKDKKGYLISESWEEVERLSGLGADIFRETVHLAKLGQYLGDANLTGAGEDLLTVMAGQRAPVA